MQESAFEVIPVIDLKNGAVVRARFGLRETYLPIASPLAATSAPLDVVAGLLRLYPFRTLYVADLDAIESRGSHDECLDALSAAFPGLLFWVDAGVGEAAAVRPWLDRHSRAHLVLGSESLRDVALLEEFGKEERMLLSLDFRGESFLGPETLRAAPHLWPSRVIVMSLARVGADLGPDMDRLGEIRGLAPDAALYAAGGLRGPSDLARLRQAGVAGVLAASALHDGRLTRADLVAAQDEHWARADAK